MNKQDIKSGCLLIALLSFVLPVTAMSDNLGLIEKRIKELDVINKKIVQSSVALPARGSLYVKAYVHDTPDGPIFVLIDKQFSETKEGVFPFKNYLYDKEL